MAHELSSTTLKILDILNDCKVHAGTDIAGDLHISRTAIWKVINRLKHYDVDIQSHHQGYGLKSPLILLDKKKIEDLINDPSITLECFETLPSTSEYLKDKIPLNNPLVCLVEHQSKGKGRMGRSWASPFGRNIYCSFSTLFHKDISEMSGLSLVVGILTANVLESLDPKVKPLLKWPNDLYVNHKKMGGILIDIIAEAYGNCTAIISVGLNINMKDAELEGVDQPWTSLEHMLNVKSDRNLIVAQLIQSVFKGIDVFAKHGMEPFLDKWKEYDLLENKHISVSQGAEIISGIARGINPQGYLLLELLSGEVRKLSYGDTTLLKNGSDSSKRI
ncbi:MAG: biotin--[acetyl-CoA-carboxylase] ligase [Alphaproteobacteria bacterium]|nr:biotin--[acetyl-CoA-carboxylase] ligase [Alphaproteobacteria bacterium]